MTLDGVHVRDPSGALVFEPLPPPTPDDVAAVAADTHRRLVRALARHGRSLDGPDDHPDNLAADEPVLASLYAASAADVQLLGDRPGQRTTKRVRPVRLVEPAGPRLVAEHDGVHVHAETWSTAGTAGASSASAATSPARPSPPSGCRSCPTAASASRSRCSRPS